jgi:hypothetical protein
MLTKHYRQNKARRSRSLLCRGSSTAFFTRRREPQRSTRCQRVLVFFALRTSAHQTALMCTFTGCRRRCKGHRDRTEGRFRRSGRHQGKRRRPKLHAWQRFGPGEIPRSVHMVQTIQREFRSRGAKADGVVAESLGSPIRPMRPALFCAYAQRGPKRVPAMRSRVGCVALSCSTAPISLRSSSILGLVYKATKANALRDNSGG